MEITINLNDLRAIVPIIGFVAIVAVPILYFKYLYELMKDKQNKRHN